MDRVSLVVVACRPPLNRSALRVLTIPARQARRLVAMDARTCAPDRWERRRAR